MQGLADGYFVLPYTLGNYLAETKQDKVDVNHAAFKQTQAEVAEQTKRLLSIKGKRTVESFHRELGNVMWNNCGMGRTEASLREALAKIPSIRAEFWKNVNVPGESNDLNQNLEKAGRVADFMELAELICLDALHRRESCGAHFREEYQTEEGEARRDDEYFAYVAAWQFSGDGIEPILNKEPLTFEYLKLSQRSYK
jgi:succinate dehydrogenase / fumarate reductase flavoprotein subunit